MTAKDGVLPQPGIRPAAPAYSLKMAAHAVGKVFVVFVAQGPICGRRAFLLDALP